MPLGRVNNATGTGAFVSIPGVVAAEPVVPGLAVSITPDGVRACSALLYPESFTGFTYIGADLNAGVSITSMRGSLIQPLVEGDVPLVSGVRVFLSKTPGRVTQDPSTLLDSGTTVLPVGVAIDSTRMVLLTDFKSLR